MNGREWEKKLLIDMDENERRRRRKTRMTDEEQKEYFIDQFIDVWNMVQSIL